MLNIPSQKLNNWEIINNTSKNFTFLYKNGELWMSNYPIDISENQEIVDKCKGKILIGGLGLGLILKQLQKEKKITSVIIIEKSPEVIEMVWEYLKLDDRFNIIKNNINNYLKTTEEKFDYVFIDIWTDMNKKIYKKEVLPLKKLAERIAPKDNIFFWKEDQFKN